MKKAIPRSEQQIQYQPQARGTNNSISNDSSSDPVRTKKIFVGGLSASISEEEFKKYFERFGRITDAVVMQDSITHRPRGFGFITFDSEDSVENVMLKNFHDLNGRQVEVKRAVPKEGNNGSDGFNKLRLKSGRGAPKSFSHYSPRYMLPGFAPLSWYSSDGLYFYGLNTYNCWYPVGGYEGNGYGVPSDAPRNFWYQPLVTNAQACQVPYANAWPSPAHVSGKIAIFGAGTKGYSGIAGSETNLKFDHVNGFVPADVTLPQVGVVKLDVDSSRLKGSNGEASS